MFAVKGWSVDAGSLKPQTEAFRASKYADDGSKKYSRKRKRGSHARDAKEDAHDRSAETARSAEEQTGVDGRLQDQKTKKQRKQMSTEAQMENTADGQSNVVGKPRNEKVESERGEEIASGSRAENLGIQKSKKKKNKQKHQLAGGAGESDATRDGQQASAKGKATDSSNPPGAPNVGSVKSPSALTPMQSAMRQKLISARFRHLNETLYTEPSAKAESLFQQNPEMFQDYHAGFRQQVSVWPENPLDKFIIAIQQRGKIRPVPQSKPGRRNGPTQFKKPSKDPANALPRTDGTAVIADLGCGDARLASTLTASGDTKRLNLKLHSFDLHGTPPYVTKADIAHIPLKDGSVDVAILCLSLMGTNWLSFIEEAHRILHWKGELWVAEIKSRFGRGSRAGKPVEHSVGGKRKQAEARKVQEIKSKEQEEAHEQEVLQAQVDGVTVTKDETDVSAFVQVLKRRGFIVKPPPETHIDLNNKMFVKMEFVKALMPVKGKGKPEGNDRAGGQGKTKFFTDEDLDADSEDEAKVLKPCLYKVR